MDIIAFIIFIIIVLQALPAPRRGKYTRRSGKCVRRRPRASGGAFRQIAGRYNTYGRGRRG